MCPSAHWYSALNCSAERREERRGDRIECGPEHVVEWPVSISVHTACVCVCLCVPVCVWCLTDVSGVRVELCNDGFEVLERLVERVDGGQEGLEGRRCVGQQRRAQRGRSWGR